MLHGVDQTSRSVLSKITAIIELADDFARRASAVTRGGGDRELLAVLFEQPYCRIPPWFHVLAYPARRRRSVSGRSSPQACSGISRSAATGCSSTANSYRS